MNVDMQLYIIRHAQSTNNALTDYQDRLCDPPLTELGRRQSEVVALHLATGAEVEPWGADGRAQHGYGITRLYCSPMWRALQTAQPNHHVHYHHLNTAISRIDFRSDGHLSVRYLNRVGHLSLELVS